MYSNDGSKLAMEQEIEMWENKLRLAIAYNPEFAPRYVVVLRLLKATYEAKYGGPVHCEKPPFDGLLTTDDLADASDVCILGRYRPHTL
jgi:hypothetical protein